MEKVNNMQEQIGNVSREMDSLRIKRTYQKTKTLKDNEKNTFHGSSIDQTQLRKESAQRNVKEMSQTGKQREK